MSGLDIGRLEPGFFQPARQRLGKPSAISLPSLSNYAKNRSASRRPSDHEPHPLLLDKARFDYESCRVLLCNMTKAETPRSLPRDKVESHAAFRRSAWSRPLPTHVGWIKSLRKSPWRRGWDSNPRCGCPYTAFRVRRIRPLCHLSAVSERLLGIGPRSKRARRLAEHLQLAKPLSREFGGSIPRGHCKRARSHIIATHGTSTISPRRPVAPSMSPPRGSTPLAMW